MNLATVPSGQLKGRHRNMYAAAASTATHAAAITAISVPDGGSMCKTSIRNATVKYLQQTSSCSGQCIRHSTGEV